MQIKDTKARRSILIALSILVPSLVALLMYLPGLEVDSDFDFHRLPRFHAILNGIATILLILGIYFIKRGKINLHKSSMLAAFILSTIFLVSYVVYRTVTGNTSYGGEGIIRYIYFFILLTHVLLSIAILPMVLFTIYHTLTNKLDKHKKLARITFPLWIYVTITGVLVYLFMAPYY